MTTATPTLADLLPHADAMVLIDTLVSWDQTHITCAADSHLASDNPLRDQGRLSVYAGVEYAAQAMAAHARLVADDGAPPRKGFLAVASKLVARVQNLDDRRQTLIIDAWSLARTQDSSMYQFRICAQGETLIEGQLTAVLGAENAP